MPLVPVHAQETECCPMSLAISRLDIACSKEV